MENSLGAYESGQCPYQVGAERAKQSKERQANRCSPPMNDLMVLGYPVRGADYEEQDKHAHPE